MQLKKNILVPLLRHKKLINRIRNDIIPFFISTNPRWRPLCPAVPPPPSENHLHAIIIMLLKLFFSEPWNLEYISITNFFIGMCTKSRMAAILVSYFSAGATIKRCPAVFSYGNIDIDLLNLQNIICQKSLIKNSNMSHF